MKVKFKWPFIVGIVAMLIGVQIFLAGEVKAQDAVDPRLAEIAADRDDFVMRLAESWAPQSNEPVDIMVEAFRAATADQLLAIDFADSYDEVLVILGTLGDLDKDYVYTPVTPCEIVDTRYGGGGFIYRFETRDYSVYGNLVAQGGSNCPAPRGEPRAVHINLIAFDPDGKGNLQAYPKGASPGPGLTANFARVGNNFANAGTIKTSYLTGTDITVTSRWAGCHAVINVLGYYYSVDDQGTRYFQSSSLNTRSVNVGTSYVRIDDFMTFNKIHASSNVEVFLNSRARAGIFASGCGGVHFQARIDSGTANWDNEAAITTSNGTDFISIFAVFSGLSAGNHTVSVWARCGPAGSSSGVLLDPGGWGGRIVVKETY